MTDRLALTTLIAAVREGSSEALDELFGLVYPELRRVAHNERARGPDGTLSTTAVVHETYIKLAGAQRLELRDRVHFFAVAASAMRQVLLDEARRRQAKKRGGGQPAVELDSNAIVVSDLYTIMPDLDRALERLRVIDERLGQVVDLRFFAGLEEEEVGRLLGVTARTVRRDWRKARAFLYRELYGASSA